MLYLANSFSLAMLPAWRLTDDYSSTKINVIPVPDPVIWVRNTEPYQGKMVSCVGHADTAAVFSKVLGREIPVDRRSIQLSEADELLVGQLVGGRLPEGSTTLPEGFKIQWLSITIDDR